MTTVLKLGGSVITDKETPETVDDGTLAAIGAEIGAALRDGTVSRLVVVHGGGSFGHHHAQRHGISATEGTREARAVAAIHGAMTDLNDAVLECLHGEGVDALPVRPLSVARREEGLELPTGTVEAMLAEGFLPVLHGDTVVETGVGARILSGDEIVVSLARSLDADRVGLCSSVPGVLDESGAVVPRVETFDEVANALGSGEGADVTGGMAGKVRALLELSTPASVFGPGDLGRFLAGERPGTVVQSR